MDDFMSEIVERANLEQAVEFAKKMIEMGKLTLEEIANVCKLPLEKVQELASTPAKDNQ